MHVANLGVVILTLEANPGQVGKSLFDEPKLQNGCFLP